MPVTVNPLEPDDQQAVRATVEHALTQGPLPKYAHLQEMERHLRGCLETLLPEAEAHASPELIKGVHAHLGDGLMSARLHVRQLAHDTRSLLGIVENGDEW